MMKLLTGDGWRREWGNASGSKSNNYLTTCILPYPPQSTGGTKKKT